MFRILFSIKHHACWFNWTINPASLRQIWKRSYLCTVYWIRFCPLLDFLIIIWFKFPRNPKIFTHVMQIQPRQLRFVFFVRILILQINWIIFIYERLLLQRWRHSDSPIISLFDVDFPATITVDVKDRHDVDHRLWLIVVILILYARVRKLDGAAIVVEKGPWVAREEF